MPPKLLSVCTQSQSETYLSHLFQRCLITSKQNKAKKSGSSLRKNCRTTQNSHFFLTPDTWLLYAQIFLKYTITNIFPFSVILNYSLLVFIFLRCICPMKLMFCIFQEMFEFYQTISNVDEELRQKTYQSSELEFKRQIDSPRRSWGSFLKFRSGIQASS